MNVTQMNEKIGSVSLFYDDETQQPFSLFMSVRNFPVNFPLLVSVYFVNIIPEKKYFLEVNISNDKKIINSFSKQSFVISEKDMILVHDNKGQSFIKTGINFNVDFSATYNITFTLKDENTNEKLDSYNFYSYIGEKQ